MADYWDNERKRKEKTVAFQINSIVAANQLIDKGEYKEACEVLLKAIEPTEPSDQYNWGVVFYHGLEGVPKDLKKAYKWFAKAYEQGDKNAAKALGYMYYDGIYVQEDYSQAFKYFKIAADKSDNEALRAIGTMYVKGLGVPKDEKCAFDNFWKAAYYGDLESQRTVGEMLIHGIGVAADEEEGVKWLEKAARRGNEEEKKFWKKEQGHKT